MTDHVDEEAARERLEQERARVGELIAELRSEGLDVEQSAQSGDLAHFDAHQEDQAPELNEREKDLAILEAARDRSRRDRGRAATARRRNVRRRRGHRRADRSRAPRRAPDRADEHRARRRLACRVVIVRLLLFAGAREAAGRGRDEFELDPRRAARAAAGRRGRALRRAFARVLGTARVWVNGDEPAAARATELAAPATRSRCSRRSAAVRSESEPGEGCSVSVRTLVRIHVRSSLVRRVLLAAVAVALLTPPAAAGAASDPLASADRPASPPPSGPTTAPTGRYDAAQTRYYELQDEQASSQRTIASLTAQQRHLADAGPPPRGRRLQARLARARRRPRQRLRHPRRGAARRRCSTT